MPMPIMIWLAVLVEAAIGNWVDMLILLLIQFVNAFIAWCAAPPLPGYILVRCYLRMSRRRGFLAITSAPIHQLCGFLRSPCHR